MDAAGILDQRYENLDDLERARNVPSLQLAGYADGRNVDLNALSDLGVRLAGRLAGLDGGKALFSGSLANQAALSDLKMNRLLEAVDRWATAQGLDAGLPPPERFPGTRLPAKAPDWLDLSRAGIRTVLWATGFRPDYSWLDVPVLDRKGRLRHEGGVVPAPGMYVLGLPFLRRRKSALIDGVGDDARELSAHLAAYLRGGQRLAQAA
jgi:putative flavoprotein involved in K+ transport